MKTLIIVRGLPGGGKTTLAKMLTRFTNVAADDFPGIYDADGKFQKELAPQAHEWCFNRVKIWMEEGEPLIAVHNVFKVVSRPEDNKYKHILPDYIELGLSYGYAVHIIHSECVILPSGEFAQSVHGVPQEVIEKMFKTWEAIDPC